MCVCVCRYQHTDSPPSLAAAALDLCTAHWQSQDAAFEPQCDGSRKKIGADNPVVSTNIHFLSEAGTLMQDRTKESPLFPVDPILAAAHEKHLKKVSISLFNLQVCAQPSDTQSS